MMNKEFTTSHPKSRRWIAVAAIVAAFSIALEVLTGFLTYRAFPSWSDRGNLGQMFGAVSALFSALALAAVAISIVLQSEELSLQRQELEFTRRELQRSADAQVATVELFRKQLDATQASLQEERERRRHLSAPLFRYYGAPAIGRTMTLQLVNEGAPIRDLRLVSKGDYAIGAAHPTDVLQTSQRIQIPLHFSINAPQNVALELSFVDTGGESRRVLVSCNIATQSAQTEEL